MRTKSLVLTTVTLLLMIFSSAEIVNFLPATLKGKVVDSRSGKPVAGVHLFISKGEEEIFSTSKGEFVLKTWHQLPVTITVEHKDYKQQTIRVTGETDPLIISLTAIQ
jgi:hypothetical protein